MFSFLSKDKDKGRDQDSRKRRQDYDRDASSPRSLKHDDKVYDRPVRSHGRSSSKDPDDRDSDGGHSSNSSAPLRRGLTVNKMSVPDTTRRSPSGSTERNERKPSLPYPSFSKAHSREAVGLRDDSVNPRLSPHTPDPTDIGPPPRSNKTTPIRTASAAPRSPPLTADHEPNLRRAKSGGSMQEIANDSKSALDRGGKSVDFGSAKVKTPRFSASSASLRNAEEGIKTSRKRSEISSASSSPTKHKPVEEDINEDDHYAAPLSSQVKSVNSQRPSEITDSDATSVGPDRRKPSAKALGRDSANRSSVLFANAEASSNTSRTTDLPPPPPPPNDTIHASRKSSRNKPPALLPRGVASSVSDFESTPITPRASFQPPTVGTHKSPQAIEVVDPEEAESEVQSNIGDPTYSAVPPPPPPPPLAPGDAPADAPKVDYLLHNGGLSKTVPKTFSSASSLSPVQPYHQFSTPQLRSQATEIDTAFAPYVKLLDDYSSVLSKNGSIAVATGYRSVARRLLDRLEAVFARNISSSTCQCIMCLSDSQSSLHDPDDTGVSWGEVLELVSARRELPPWPPFSIATSNSPLGIHELERTATPFQAMDIDVPEEYREHYIRQSKKTKQAVTNWLAAQPEDHVSPPQEVDDETLTFAMLTYLESDQRKVFAALTRGSSTLPESRAPTPAVNEPKSDLMSRVGLALQRLYRLPRQPRIPECAMYLLKNPALHNALATLAAISSGEWDILISGRFDGFLWSGAEDSHATGTPPSRNASRAQIRQPNMRSSSFSRTMTPFSSIGNGNVPLRRGSNPPNHSPAMGSPSMVPSRGPTPAFPSTPNGPLPDGATTPAPGGPVQMDEDTELAVLAEVEREIYTGMEALEDAFEVLHLKAEAVRNSLRERSAAIAIRAQARRGAADNEIEVRMGTPASGAGGWWGGNFNGNTTGNPAPSGAGIANLTGAWGFGGSGTGTPVLNSANVSDNEEMVWGAEEKSELAPDDSASNVGFRHRQRDRDRERNGHSHDKGERKRRPRRRTERKTPAPVEEEESNDEILVVQEG